MQKERDSIIIENKGKEIFEEVADNLRCREKVMQDLKYMYVGFHDVSTWIFVVRTPSVDDGTESILLCIDK